MKMLERIAKDSEEIVHSWIIIGVKMDFLSLRGELKGIGLLQNKEIRLFLYENKKRNKIIFDYIQFVSKIL